MAYQKQNFKSWQLLYASQLNAMDEQIAANEAAIEGKAGAAEMDAAVNAVAQDVQRVMGNVDALGERVTANEAEISGKVSAEQLDEAIRAGVDDTLTQEGQAADAKATGEALQALGDDVEQLHSDVDGMFTGLAALESTGKLTADDFTWGFVNGSTGAIVGQKNRAVTIDYLPDHVALIECAYPYKIRVSAWERDSGAFVGNWDGSAWGNSTANHSRFDAFIPEYRYKICVVETVYDAQYTDFTEAAASVTLFSNTAGGTRDDVIDALRRKSLNGSSLVIADAIAGKPIHCACDSPVSVSGLNILPVRDVSFVGSKTVPLGRVYPAGTYRLSAVVESTDTDADTALVRFGGLYIYLKHDGKRYSQKITTKEDASAIIVYASSDATNSSGDTAFWRDMMLAEGGSDAPFEPYREPQVYDNPAELVLTTDTNIISADSPIDITYIVRNAWLTAVLSATKSVELTWQTLGYVTPEMFGAVGDGVTDDTQAMQACIDLSVEKRIPARAMKSYGTTSSLTIGSFANVWINELKYTGSDTAVILDCEKSRLEMRKLTSGGIGVKFLGETVDAIGNELVIGSAECQLHCIVFESTAKAVSGNRITFSKLSAGGDGCYCIANNLTENASYVTEQSFFGGLCTNADWAFYGGGGNNKFYSVQVENNIKGGFCFVNSANVQIHGDRHTESARDGEYPFIRITTPDGIMVSMAQAITAMQYVSSMGLSINEIDVSGVSMVETYSNGSTLYLRNNGSLGVINCRILSYAETGSDNPKIRQYFGERALIWGPCLIFQGAPEKYWSVTGSMDLRTITDETPAMPTVFDIACENAEIRLHPTYCFMGISRFEVIQTPEHTATIYDYYTGNVIFDGPSLGAGTFEVRTLLNGDYARLDGSNMIWKVRKISV